MARDFTAFTAVREEFCPPRWCDNDKQPLPNAKRQPLAASNQPVTDKQLPADNRGKCEEKNNNEEMSTIVMKELRPGGQGRRGQSIDAKRWHDTSNVEALTVWAQYAHQKYTRRCKRDEEKLKRHIIARHPAM
ncbi:hypothetical protein EVAR_75963_1 [Eumeta japonica]|uniref:Uncharacterized protein n=1 Tax=Eumeta variegata TaxID=151549 RepID=A0A4C1UA50_EUMVA|nr:hypothetical protein EVAR_75963_1 [Eumeta japonica]